MKLALSRVDWDVAEDYESVDMIGVWGIRVSGLEAHVRHMRLILPTVVVIDAGTNDMCSPHCQGTMVAARLHDFVCQFAKLPSVRHVIVGEVIRRCGRNRKYEQERVACNRELRRLSEKRTDIHTLRLRGLKMNIQQCLLRDNVHLNQRVMKHYVMNIRKEVRHWAKRWLLWFKRQIMNCDLFEKCFRHSLHSCYSRLCTQWSC